MSILIKDMEMPTSCESCPCKTADAFGGLGCQATGYIPLRKANQDRPDGCPLVPVPPHGDLVDRREAIIDANERAYDFWLSDDEVNSTIQFLNEQAAVIPADPGEEETE